MCLKQLKEQVFRITSLSAHVISRKYPPKAEIQHCFDTSVSALTGRECQPIPIWNATRKNKACQNESERCLLRATCGERKRGRKREREKSPSHSTWLCPWNTFPAAPPTVGDSDRILSVQRFPSVWLMSLILPINGKSPVDCHQIAVFICYSSWLWFILISQLLPHRHFYST